MARLGAEDALFGGRSVAALPARLSAGFAGLGCWVHPWTQPLRGVLSFVFSDVILNSIQDPSEIGVGNRFDRGKCLIRGLVRFRGALEV